MRVVIVDDEYYALQGLKIKLSEIKGVELVGVYDDSTKFLSDVLMLNPDLILLDIEMPKKTGLEVLSEMRKLGVGAMVIFVAAYSHYQEKISSTDALGFMLKPFTVEQLHKAIANAKNKISENNENKKKE